MTAVFHVLSHQVVCEARIFTVGCTRRRVVVFRFGLLTGLVNAKGVKLRLQKIVRVLSFGNGSLYSSAF